MHILRKVEETAQSSCGEWTGKKAKSQISFRPAGTSGPSNGSPTGAPNKYPLSGHQYATTGSMGRTSASPAGGPRVVVGANRSTTPFPVNSDDLRQAGVKTQVRHLPHQYASTGSIQGLGIQSNTLPGLRVGSTSAKPGITMVARPTVLAGGSTTSSSSTFALRRQGSAPGAAPPPPPPAYANSLMDDPVALEQSGNATFPGNARSQHGPNSGQSGRVSQYARLPLGRGQQGNGSLPAQRRQSGTNSASGPQQVC